MNQNAEPQAVAQDKTPADGAGGDFDFRICTRCVRRPAKKGDSYCRECRNAYHRAWRRTRTKTDEATRRDRTRSYSATYFRRGKIPIHPCARCGTANDLVRHHPDYDKPLLVEWLCRSCHRTEHAEVNFLVKTYEVYLLTERAESRRRAREQAGGRVDAWVREPRADRSTRRRRAG